MWLPRLPSIPRTKEADVAMRKLGKFWLIFLALATLLLVLAVACEEEEEKETPTGTPTAAVTGTPAETPTQATETPGITPTQIILGLHGPLSGTWGAAYAPVIGGVDAYFKYANAEEDGACDRDIILKIEDDQYLPAGAVEAVKKLLDRDEVFAMVASIGTAAHSAVWEDLNERGVPDLWIMSGAHKWAAEPEKYPWSIPLLPDYYIEGTIFGEYISENMPGKKVGLLRQNDDWGDDVEAGLKNGLDPDKNEFASVQSYELTAVSIRSQVASLKSAGAEVVVAASNPPSTSQLIREADRLGWHPQFFVDYVNSDPMMFLYASPELMEGVITLQGNKMWHQTDDPDIAEHHRIMQEYGDYPAGNFTVVGAAAAALTVDALRAACDNLTREGLMDAIYSTFTDYQGEITLEGITTDLSPTDHFAIEAMKMLRAHDGEWEYFGEIIPFVQED
jgi:branched-chain amino acid transport system substrate-binding protein